jgi:hypothetical protein
VSWVHVWAVGDGTKIWALRKNSDLAAAGHRACLAAPRAGVGLGSGPARSVGRAERRCMELRRRGPARRSHDGHAVGHTARHLSARPSRAGRRARRPAQEPAARAALRGRQRLGCGEAAPRTALRIDVLGRRALGRAWSGPSAALASVPVSAAASAGGEPGFCPARCGCERGPARRSHFGTTFARPPAIGCTRCVKAVPPGPGATHERAGLSARPAGDGCGAARWLLHKRQSLRSSFS